ncbi:MULTISPECIES: bifunctional indole-3-glycerol-phosphate synthase TrpC/phosphoribosylanthranilate isomerase TrpF [unclassified Corynebacterium]|uniref:bifunctional indole-3-glycerol-phosphate synthase TrpC/phosphoribosylanthranilate isomerase TrpF n=1 Tax=unclassified Corynebacterium TaxID=2624378 RepID=UPI00163D6E3D|nr:MULTISPECIES: bifunctional indole-3-glycerol-phosphate synthase TrpC/phosphoribosylanthranilate isomerase TrpF [unclassified Corynebacterium]
MSNSLPTVLEDIVSHRREHLAEIRARIAHVDVQALEKSDRSLYDNLCAGGRGAAHFIMECKSASPSLGLIRADYRPAEIASIYSRYAAGISVLCEPERFGGDYDHLAVVRASTHLPVLCKDFIIDEVQVYAARYFGADAILLMLSILDDETYTRLSTLATHLGLDILTEVIDEHEVSRGTALGAQIFGINHRNLHDLSIDLTRSERLSALIPDNALIVAESGIRDVHTVRSIRSHSHGFLVGSHLTGQEDIDSAARELIYGSNKVCGLQTPAAASAARAMGAVYGGLIFHKPSPRSVSHETAKKIVTGEPHLRYVAITTLTNNFTDFLNQTQELKLSALQLHAPYQGSLEAELNLIDQARTAIRSSGAHIELWRAVSMTHAEQPEELARNLMENVDKLVLDAGNGGTGMSFDWSRIPHEIKTKSLLAGGIGTKNIEEALRVNCLGVDINSGVEYPQTAQKWAGQKDSAQLREIFAKIRNFNPKK